MIELEGTFMRCGVKNANGRTYDSSIMQQAISDYQKKVADGKAFGYLGDNQDRYCLGEITHPSENIGEISHQITEVNFDENTGKLFGKVKLLDTPRGKIAQAALELMGTMGIAMCGTGEIDKDGIIKSIQKIDWFNLCNNPAWEDAIVKPIKE